MDETLLHFVETTVFTRRIDKLASREILFDLQNDLLLNPKRGDVIQEGGGARKARVADKGQNRGKSGSFRYIYLYLEKPGIIYLFMFYGKNEKDNLSDEEKKIVAALVKQFKDFYGETDDGK